MSRKTSLNQRLRSYVKLRNKMIDLGLSGQQIVIVTKDRHEMPSVSNLQWIALASSPRKPIWRVPKGPQIGERATIVPAYEAMELVNQWYRQNSIASFVAMMDYIAEHGSLPVKKSTVIPSPRKRKKK